MPRPAADEIAEELRHVVSTLRRRLRGETTGEPIAYPLRSMLRRLDVDGPATTADLARAELITPQSAGALVARLEAEGYVARSDDDHDGRRRLVQLTPAGRKVVAARRAERQSWLAQQIRDRLDADEQQTVATALALLRGIVDS